MDSVRGLLSSVARAGLVGVGVAALSLASGCDDSKSRTKTTEKTVQETPQGTTTTTETHEKTVEVDKK